MAQTVSEVLTAGLDSVSVINDINTDAYNTEGMTQSDINDLVQRNVDHLETILAYAPVDSDDDTPNVVGSSNSKKNNCTSAIATGKTYISNNS